MDATILADQSLIRRTDGPKTRFLFVLPIAVALAYPWILAGITAIIRSLAIASPPPAIAIILTVLATLTSAAVVVGISGWTAVILARQPNSVATMRARAVAHIAFAAPSFLTAVDNVGGAIHERGFSSYSLPLFWAAMAAFVLFAPATPVHRTSPHYRKIVLAHATSACAIILLFIVPHIGDHLTGIWSGTAHIQTMNVVRQIYRNPIIEPALLGLILFQIATGVMLIRQRIQRPTNLFGTIQGLTGFYVGIFFLGHVTAVLLARSHGTDTNWNWLTSHDKGLLFRLSASAVMAHYWIGPIAIITHLACGLRVVAIQNHVSPVLASRVAVGIIGLGVVASTVILAGLLGFHVA